MLKDKILRIIWIIMGVLTLMAPYFIDRHIDWSQFSTLGYWVVLTAMVSVSIEVGMELLISGMIDD